MKPPTNSLKDGIRKFTTKSEVEWDKILSITSTAHNFSSVVEVKSQDFPLMFGRDVYIPTLANLLQPKLRYSEGESSMHSIEMLSNSKQQRKSGM